MGIEQGLFQLVQSNGALASLVLMTNGKGVYWILAPKGAAIPMIVLSRAATTDEYTYAGATGFRNSIFQIDCYGSTYYQSHDIANAVRELLQDYKGTLPDSVSTVVASVQTIKDWDMPYEEGVSQTGFIYRAMLQFRIWYND